MFAVAATATLPFPVPVLPLLTVSHVAPLAAVQEHVDVVVTPTTPVLTPAGSDTVFVDSVYPQELTAAWFTEIVWPPTVTVAVRPEPEAFGATFTVREALPVPLAGVTVAHVWLDAVVHVQVDALTESATLKEPPVAGVEMAVGEGE